MPNIFGRMDFSLFKTVLRIWANVFYVLCSLGKVGCRHKKRGGWDGSTRDKIWRLSLLHTTC